MQPKLEVFSTPQALAQAAAERVLQICNQAVQKKGRADLVLSGGSSPLAVYELLSSKPHADNLPWPLMHIFWGDERAVSPDHPDSNYRAWLNHGGANWPLGPEQIHAIPGGLGAEPGALAYENTLRQHFGPAQWPGFDLVLLGMGPDGHYASLFPHVPALGEKSRWVCPIEAPSHIGPHLPRISLSPPAINAAQEVLFLVTGAGKAETLLNILGPGAVPGPGLPASLVQPRGVCTWFLDEAANPLP